MTTHHSVHEQLLELCTREIDAGKWPAGQRFPSERELAETHGISRPTANKVINKLVSEGWLELRKGQGAFVAERPTLFASLRRLESFTAYAAAQGFSPATRVTHYEPRTAAPAAVRASLHLPADADVIFFRRVRLADNAAVICEERWLPAYRYPGLAAKALGGSFYQLCQDRFDLRVEREDAEIRAVLLPADLAAACDISWDAPALRLDGTGYDRDGVPLWTQRLYYHGERFALLNHAGTSRGFPNFTLTLSQPLAQPPKNP